MAVAAEKRIELSFELIIGRTMSSKELGCAKKTSCVLQ
jgi:hypothetical protein